MVGEEGIPPTASCFNIGVVFDDTLTFETHVNSVYKTSFWHLRSIWSITWTKSSLEILIHAFITNKLDYCDSLLTGLPKYLIKRIQPVQNAAARLVSGSKKHDHITPILHELHGLPVERRITYKILSTTFKCLNNLTPSFLPDLIIQFKPKQTLRSSSKNLLVIPRTNTTRYGERAFCAVAPGLWMIYH